MKPNSLVVIKKLPPEYSQSEWLPNDNESDIYTIRDIGKDQFNEDDMVTLVEGCLGFVKYQEVGIPVCFVREVQPPEEVDAQQVVEEAICELI